MRYRRKKIRHGRKRSKGITKKKKKYKGIQAYTDVERPRSEGEYPRGSIGQMCRRGPNRRNAEKAQIMRGSCQSTWKLPRRAKECNGSRTEMGTDAIPLESVRG